MFRLDAFVLAQYIYASLAGRPAKHNQKAFKPR
jgi:hypothetical protein